MDRVTKSSRLYSSYSSIIFRIGLKVLKWLFLVIHFLRYSFMKSEWEC